MAKYRYMIHGVGYGGELVVGTVKEDFVRYWLPRVEEEGADELIEALHEDHEFDEPEDALLDPDVAPLPIEDYVSGAWYELDDIEHINSTFADGYFEVYELDDNDEEVDDTNTRYNLNECHVLYGRECYFGNEREESDNDEDEIVPVLSILSSEKGGFWNAIIETDEPFDIELVAVGNVESNLGELSETIYYDGKELELEYDFADSSGKGIYAELGWLNKRWHDAEVNEEDMQYALTDWRDSLED